MFRRPPPLPVSQTHIYKTVGKEGILIDLYLPDNQSPTHPIVLFLHGGGWITGSRGDYSRPLFQRLLAQGCIVAAPDYRLLLETSLAGQFEDIRDLELWLRNDLPSEINTKADSIVVIGASAGAHLALMTPKLWNILPIAIVSLYGPTNMHHLPSLNPIEPELANSILLKNAETAFDFESCPTEFLPAEREEDLDRPRTVFTRTVFRANILPVLLLRRLLKDTNGAWMLPMKESVSTAEIDAISPLHMVQQIPYPPVYQVVAGDDQIFDTSHGQQFREAHLMKGGSSELLFVPAKRHAFDIGASEGDEVDRKVLRPVVEWIMSLT